MVVLAAAQLEECEQQRRKMKYCASNRMKYMRRILFVCVLNKRRHFIHTDSNCVVVVSYNAYKLSPATVIDFDVLEYALSSNRMYTLAARSYPVVCQMFRCACVFVHNQSYHSLIVESQVHDKRTSFKYRKIFTFYLS